MLLWLVGLQIFEANCAVEDGYFPVSIISYKSVLNSKCSLVEAQSCNMYESIPFHSLNPEDIFQMGTIALPKATGLPIHGECGFE